MSRLGEVPCGHCKACCKSELIVLLPDEGDKVETYEHEIIPIEGQGTVAALKHKKNGECIYLARNGCTIRSRRPHICRIFDCRAFYLSKTRAERLEHRKHGAVARAILTAGRDRVKTLDVSELANIPRK
jgi:Fe-S-cluster containining protein